MKWISLTESAQLKTISEESENMTIAIFKHSTSCGISKMILKRFEAEAKSADLANTKMYYLDLLSYRSISNEIAKIFNVRHESPQLLVIKNGVVKHHSSHSSIYFSALA